ncbi:MAG: (2Fe-2S)-binding protein [Acidimicrobiia bacterium]|nr:(2Fe-2S)-binding protein [Acidimicrobiia bacterium]
MAQINVGDRSFDVEDGIRLVLALEDNGVDILHRCGGNAACTTCRVTFSDGEPETMRDAERDVLQKREVLGEVRLSCQILTEGIMSVEPLMTVGGTDFDDPGGRPTDTMAP